MSSNFVKWSEALISQKAEKMILPMRKAMFISFSFQAIWMNASAKRVQRGCIEVASHEGSRLASVGGRNSSLGLWHCWRERGPSTARLILFENLPLRSG